MEFKAAVFDLDGTLLDTLADLSDSANAMLEARGFPVHPMHAYRHFVGDGMEMLVKRCIPEEYRKKPVLLMECLEEFRENYAARWNVKTQPYEGIGEMLSALVASGLKLAVLSNKAQDFTDKCVDHYLADWPWQVVMGLREGIAPKPNQAGAVEILRQLSVEAAECLYFGDTAVDMQTASRAGMFSIGVLWGFRDEKELRGAGANLLLRKPADYVKMPF